MLERRSCMEVARKTYLLLDSCSNMICEHIAWLRAGITIPLVANQNIPFFLTDTVVTPESPLGLLFAHHLRFYTKCAELRK